MQKEAEREILKATRAICRKSLENPLDHIEGQIKKVKAALKSLSQQPNLV